MLATNYTRSVSITLTCVALFFGIMTALLDTGERGVFNTTAAGLCFTASVISGFVSFFSWVIWFVNRLEELEEKDKLLKKKMLLWHREAEQAEKEMMKELR